MEKRIEEDIPILGRVSVNLVDLASRIFEIYLSQNEIERQRKTPHLGLISKAFKGITHSRYDYLILQLVVSELVENNFKGTTSAQGNIKINGKSYFGNDIIKSWCLLSNFGHCLNTIGDEKTILLKAIQNKRFKTYLISSIKDDDLKKWGEEIIDNFNYVEFHHLLAIRRIYKSLPRRVVFKNEIISVYKLLLLDSNSTKMISNSLQVEQLKSIYRNIRNLCIISLDTRNSSLPISIDILNTVLSLGFYENRHQETKRSELFNPLLSLLYDELYLHPKCQTYQRSYEVSATATLPIVFNDIVEKAIKEGLTDPESCELSHFLRSELHEDYIERIDLKGAIRNVLTVKREIPDVEASMDYNPFSKVRVMDFYTKKNSFTPKMLPKFLSNIEGILEKQITATVNNYIHKNRALINGVKDGMQKANLSVIDSDEIFNSLRDQIFMESWEIVQSQNIPTYRDILWAVLRFYIKDQYYFDIDHHVSKTHNFFGVRLKNGIDLLNNQIESAIIENTNLDRVHELKQLQRSTKKTFNGTTIACLSRITVYDYSKAPDKRKVTDIDALVLKFNSENVILEIHESKNTKKSFLEAKKDLKNKFVQVLNSNSSGYQIREVKNFGAKIVINHKSVF